MKKTTLSGRLPKQIGIVRFVVEKRKALVDVIAALLILLFVYTSFSKFADFTSFRSILKLSPLIGNMNVVVAWLLPTVEILVSALLFFPRTRYWGLLCSFILMTIFTLYVGYMIAFTPDKPCSCGGVLRQMTWNMHLGFNIFFTIIAFWGIQLKKQIQQETF